MSPHFHSHSLPLQFMTLFLLVIQFVQSISCYRLPTMSFVSGFQWDRHIAVKHISIASFVFEFHTLSNMKCFNTEIKKIIKKILRFVCFSTTMLFLSPSIGCHYLIQCFSTAFHLIESLNKCKIKWQRKISLSDVIVYFM